MNNENTDYRIMAAVDWAQTIHRSINITTHPLFERYFGSFTRAEFEAALVELDRRAVAAEAEANALLAVVERRGKARQ